MEQEAEGLKDLEEQAAYQSSEMWLLSGTVCFGAEHTGRAFDSAGAQRHIFIPQGFSSHVIAKSWSPH